MGNGNENDDRHHHDDHHHEDDHDDEMLLENKRTNLQISDKREMRKQFRKIRGKVERYDGNKRKWK